MVERVAWLEARIEESVGKKLTLTTATNGKDKVRVFLDKKKSALMDDDDVVK